jgi:sugar lactone lactonase YvrE
MTAEKFYACCNLLGEGPLWSHERLWWVDILQGQIHSLDAAGHDHKQWDVGLQVASFAFAGENSLIVAAEDRIGLYDLRDGSLEIIARLEHPEADMRFNDGKCDPFGKFLAGTMHTRGKRGMGTLYSYDPINGAVALRGGIGISNGMAWSLDRSTLYFIDTPTLEIVAYDYPARPLPLGEGRVVVRVPPELGMPDGMTIDTNGNLWVAHWDGGAVRCWCPSTGRCIEEIQVPCARPTSCCFGGEGYRFLFITSARKGVSPSI